MISGLIPNNRKLDPGCWCVLVQIRCCISCWKGCGSSSWPRWQPTRCRAYVPNVATRWLTTSPASWALLSTSTPSASLTMLSSACSRVSSVTSLILTLLVVTYLTEGWKAGADSRVKVGVGWVTSSIEGGGGNVRMTFFMYVIRMCLPFGLLWSLCKVDIAE